MTLVVGSAAPDFTLPTDGGGSVTLSDLRGKPAIVYFYPKDDTSGCTKQACAFRDALADFSAIGAAVIGISRDSVAAHDKFKDKYGLNFVLASDESGQVCQAWGTWVEKSMYGRKYMGIDRATFLIGADGLIRAVWRKVNVTGHVDAVLEAAKSA